MPAELTDKQKAALERFKKLKVGALFMRQGTGKTRVALELVNYNKPDYLLYIAPVSTIENARAEIEKWGCCCPYDIIGYETIASTTSPQTRYARNMFNGCNCLRKVFFPASVSGLGERAFCLSSLEKFEIPDSVVVDDGTVGHNFYQSYSLRECIMGSGCTVIPRNAFDSCYRLQRIECRGDVTAVSSGAIGYCRSLKTLDLTHCSSVPSLTAAWYGTPDDLQILVPAALADEWKKATNWVAYADKIIGV